MTGKRRFLFVIVFIITLIVIVFAGQFLLPLQPAEALLPEAVNECLALDNLTVETVFDRMRGDDQRPEIASGCRIVIHATGDVLLARVPNHRMIKLDNLNWVLERVADELRNADIVIVNLENPLTADCQPTLTGMIFCGRLENVQTLIYGGVNVVNIANNHIGNKRLSGVDSTIRALHDAGITVTGADTQNLATKEINGVRFAFLGYNEVDRQPGAAFPDKERVENEIAQARQRVGDAGVVIVSLHGGIEYTHEPTHRQRQIAHWAIDAGADLIIGHHPHWYQGVEMYNGKLIMYSLGNFVFDQMWSHKTRVGLMARLVFNRNQLVDVEFLPVMIEDYGQPRWMTVQEAAVELRNLEVISRRLGAP